MLVDCLEAVRIVGVLIAPVTPSLSQRILAQLGLDASSASALEQAQWGGAPCLLNARLHRAARSLQRQVANLHALVQDSASQAAGLMLSLRVYKQQRPGSIFLHACRAAEGAADEQACARLQQAGGRVRDLSCQQDAVTCRLVDARCLRLLRVHACRPLC